MPTDITIQGILFDMDGTLLDSTPAVEKTLGDWCKTQDVNPAEFFAVSHVRLSFPLGSEAKLTRCGVYIQGVRTRDNVKKFQKYPKLGANLTEEELVKTVDELELAIAENGRKLAEAGGQGIVRLPGVEKLLSALREGGVRWGIVTSATNAYADSALVTGEIVPPALPFRITGNQCTHGKPHPEPYLKGLDAMRQLPGSEIDPAKVLVFEDAPSGLKSGLAAGCKTLAVCTSHTRAQIEGYESTYKVLDLERVEVVKADGESITLRLKELHEE
ncbi:2-deoxyglucose-6-phosphatase [Pseudohyphozyma bogoriensis]|nr:2-deoxyglucose-6-phosphatase [Pseudohyphozyma bogoriensis]